MPHIPGHNRPFTSFLTQGMQNTNRNIGNFNNPGGQTNYLTPPNNNLFDPSNFTGEGMPSGEGGQTPPGMGIGGWYNPWGVNPNYVTYPEKPMKEYPEKPIGRPPEDKLPHGWEWQMVGGNWEPVNIGGELASHTSPPSLLPGWGNTINPPNYLQETPALSTGDMVGEWWDTEGMMQGGFDVNNDGVVNAQDAIAAQSFTSAPFMDYTMSNVNEFGIPDFWSDWLEESQPTWEDQPPGMESSLWTNPFVEGNVRDLFDFYSGEAGSPWYEGNEGNMFQYLQLMSQYPGSPGAGDYVPSFLEHFSSSQGGFEGMLGDFQENLQSYIRPGEISPQQFTGGGGMGGQAAKQLYYPGTLGGFAGVGSGIGGGNKLQSLLQGLTG